MYKYFILICRCRCHTLNSKHGNLYLPNLSTYEINVTYSATLNSIAIADYWSNEILNKNKLTIETRVEQDDKLSILVQNFFLNRALHNFVQLIY